MKSTRFDVYTKILIPAKKCMMMTLGMRQINKPDAWKEDRPVQD